MKSWTLWTSGEAIEAIEAIEAHLQPMVHQTRGLWAVKLDVSADSTKSAEAMASNSSNTTLSLLMFPVGLGAATTLHREGKRGLVMPV